MEHKNVTRDPHRADTTNKSQYYKNKSIKEITIVDSKIKTYMLQWHNQIKQFLTSIIKAFRFTYIYEKIVDHLSHHLLLLLLRLHLWPLPLESGPETWVYTRFTCLKWRPNELELEDTFTRLTTPETSFFSVEVWRRDLDRTTLGFRATITIKRKRHNIKFELFMADLFCLKLMRVGRNYLGEFEMKWECEAYVSCNLFI